MATKRKRRTKHRGNASGIVEARGRTGRRPESAEKSAKNRKNADAREKRLAKYDRPPTWSGAFKRSLLASVFVVAIGVLLFKKPTQAAVTFPIVLIFYVPLSYYFDMFLYNRRQRQKKAAGRAR
jgi:hypothetical protein